MTLRINAELAAILAAAQDSNNVWSTALKTALGATRRVICVRHANAATPDANVYATGVVFRNAALTGDMVIASGVITNYGSTSGLTVSLAADLGTGKSVMRIEGGGHWIEGTLGLPNSGCDFTVPVNPTTTNSIAVAPNMRINPPPFLPSGTGYAPPAVFDADAPAYITHEDWTDPLNPVTTPGRILLNKRIQNWTFQRPRTAAQMGDIRVTQSNDMLTVGGFEFGATLFSANPAINSVPGKVLHQVVIAIKPTSGPSGNWPRYPRTGGYRRGTRDIDGTQQPYGISDTFYAPCKFHLHRADDSILFTWEQRDGLPLNSPEMSEVPTKSKPIRPKNHCGSVLFWESQEPILSTDAHRLFPGVDSMNLRPSMCKEKAAFNAPYPMYYVAQPSFASGHWYAMPKWAIACSIEAMTADQATRQDPYLFSMGPSNNPEGTPWGTKTWMVTYHNVPPEEVGTLGYGMAAYQGWGFEPGSWACHDQYTGPGGMRVDRSFLPTPIVIHMTNPNFVHSRDNTPITEMVKHWNRAYFNHHYFHFEDVRTLQSIPPAEVMAGMWSYGESYYGGLPSYGTGGVEYAIPQFAISASPTYFDNRPHGGAPVDANFRMPWNGAAIDSMHNYSCPGAVALLYNSPAHALAAKMRYLASQLCQLGSVPASANPRGYFGIRTHAWRWAQHAWMWALGSDHPLGITQEMVEDRMAAEMTACYNDIVVPTRAGSTDMFCQAMRNFGINVAWDGVTWNTKTQGLTYYMAHVLQFMRQTGMWKRMMERSAICREVLLFTIEILDKSSLDFFLDTEGRQENYLDLWKANKNSENGAVICTSWVDWCNTMRPKTGPSENWIHNGDGTFRTFDVAGHMRAQWPFIRRDYFADIPALRDVNAVCTLVQGWQNEYATRIATLEADGVTTKTGIRQKDWNCQPALGRILPPTELEP